MAAGKLQTMYNDLAIAAFGITKEEAIINNQCIMCKENPPRFYSEQGKKEYKISGLCEYCFDKMFTEGEY